MCFEGKWLQTRLGADENDLIPLSAVDIQAHQLEFLCIAPIISSDN